MHHCLLRYVRVYTTHMHTRFRNDGVYNYRDILKKRLKISSRCHGGPWHSTTVQTPLYMGTAQLRGGVHPAVQLYCYCTRRCSVQVHTALRCSCIGTVRTAQFHAEHCDAVPRYGCCAGSTAVYCILQYRA